MIKSSFDLPFHTGLRSSAFRAALAAASAAAAVFAADGAPGGGHRYMLLSFIVKKQRCFRPFKKNCERI